MQGTTQNIKDFIAFAAKLQGDEKGEAQIFLDRLFRAFGHAGSIEVGGIFEYRVHPGKTTKFADLVWPRRVLIEMKKRGEKLQKHYLQAREYWINLTKDRARYVILCNFDEFWIYDFDYQMSDPVDRVPLLDLPTRYTALNFLFPIEKEPQFNNDLVKVTRKAAQKVADAFNSMITRDKNPIPRETAQRLILQSVVALFAEDIELLPRGFFTELLNDCRKPGGSSYDLLGGLFRQMANKKRAQGGRFQEVDYFNGGLFDIVEPVDLSAMELQFMSDAAKENWATVNPAIFGAIFEGSMGKEERHAAGAHFTSEADIQKVVYPTIVRPWRERITAAKGDKELVRLWQELHRFRVLDPACGSGNFLYLAYREMRRIEWELITLMGEKTQVQALAESAVGANQFFGIDIKPFAVELAKVELMLAKKLALDERVEFFEQHHLAFNTSEQPLPLDKLDANIVCQDALFGQWPKVDAIIGNPPFQSKNKMQQEFGPEYVQKIRAQYPAIPGRADYCVYWFRRAHDELEPGCRSGLVGTNTIRQNYAREGGLDYIVGHGGTITEAVSTQVWSGEAAVHVSIVNWVKGAAKGKKKIAFQKGDNRHSPWEVLELDTINSALSASADVSEAVRLTTNIDSGACYQGQTHGHEGFLLDDADAAKLMKKNPRNRNVIFPYLTADEMLSIIGSVPDRFVIDFHARDVMAAGAYKEPFQHVERFVLPTRQQAAKEETDRNKKILEANPKAKVNHHHRNFLNKWWHLSYSRQELIAKIGTLPRYIVCGRVTKRPIFEILSSVIRPNDALQVFAFPDDYSFGVLQSGIHWAWFVARCSTLKGDFRYTSDTVFDTFPWPQAPTLAEAKKVAAAAVGLRAFRRKVMADNNWSLRDLYRKLDVPGLNPLRDLHNELDDAVRAAYGMKAKADVLAFLLELNHLLAAAEKAGTKIVGPGLPPCVENPADFITTDCVQPPVLP